MRIAIMVLAVYCTTSCVNLSEEITLNEDGSGEYSMYSDMVATQVEMAVQMAMMFADDQEVNEDSLRIAMTEKTWEEMPENVDSLHTAFEIPDSLKKDPKMAAMLDKFQGFTEGGREKGVVNTGVRFTFTNMSNLNEMHETMSNFQDQKDEKSGGGMGPKMDPGKQSINFDFDDTHFKKTTNWEKEPDLKEQDLEMLESFLGKATFSSIVHLPRKMKKVDKTHLRHVSEDGKTLTFEYSILEMIQGKVDHNFDIELEKK